MMHCVIYSSFPTSLSAISFFHIYAPHVYLYQGTKCVKLSDLFNHGNGCHVICWLLLFLSRSTCAIRTIPFCGNGFGDNFCHQPEKWYNYFKFTCICTNEEGKKNSIKIYAIKISVQDFSNKQQQHYFFCCDCFIQSLLLSSDGRSTVSGHMSYSRFYFHQIWLSWSSKNFKC